MTVESTCQPSNTVFAMRCCGNGTQLVSETCPQLWLPRSSDVNTNFHKDRQAEVELKLTFTILVT